MKHFLSFMICAAMLSFVACDKSDDNKDVNPTPEAASAVGKVFVTQTDGSEFSKDSVSVSLTYAEDSMTITMFKVKFAERMPLELDMTIGGVQYSNNGGDIKLWGDNIVPQAMGGAFPKYTITNLDGKVGDGKVSFSMMCGEFPTRFEGTLKQ